MQGNVRQDAAKISPQVSGQYKRWGSCQQLYQSSQIEPSNSPFSFWAFPLVKSIDFSPQRSVPMGYLPPHKPQDTITHFPGTAIIRPLPCSSSSTSWWVWHDTPFLSLTDFFVVFTKREYVADAYSALYTKYPEGLASALEHCSRTQHLPKVCKEDYAYVSLSMLKLVCLYSR